MVTRLEHTTLRLRTECFTLRIYVRLFRLTLNSVTRILRRQNLIHLSISSEIHKQHLVPP